ncbi:MAG: Hint domain-containing protein [Pseudomonadota bacterium]
MANISELHYSNAYSNATGVSEFLEVTLLPGEDPADFTVAFYQANGDFGIAVALTDPDVIVATDAATGRGFYQISEDDFPILLTDPDGGGSTNYEAYALVDTSTVPGTVVQFLDIGGGTTNITADGGPADGAVSSNIPVPTGPNAATYSIQFLPGDPGTPIYEPLTEGGPVICFCAGAMIATPDGPRAVEELQRGDLVQLETGGAAQIRWTGHRHVTADEVRRDRRLRPVRVAAGSLGPGQPERDLWVSQQHRFLVRGPIAERVFGRKAVLVRARDMIALDGVAISDAAAPVDYHHFAIASHGCVIANGAVAETLFPGPMALAALTAEARAELIALFGADELARLHADTPIPPVAGRRARRMIARHAANNKPLVTPA